MALRDYYRCKQCDAKIAYNPNRPEEEWEPFLLCRSCLADAETENTRLREALKTIKAYCHGEEEVNGFSEISDIARAALNPPKEQTDANTEN